MLTISGLKEGIVLDHIQAGKAMKIYKYLGLDELDHQIAIIKNAPSKKMGRKDIIKIDDAIDIDMNVLGYIDPGITINVIEDGVIVEKKHIELPEKLVNVIRCKNPRCITSVEPELDQVFLLKDPVKRVYRCMYCDAERSKA